MFSRLKEQVRLIFLEDRARYYFATLQHAKAIPFLEEALEMRPDHLVLLEMEAWARYYADEYNHCLEALDDIWELTKGKVSSDWHHCRGMALHALGNYKEAITEYNRGVDMTRNPNPILYSRSLAYHKDGQYEMAALDLTHSIKHLEFSVTVWRKAAQIFQDANRHVEVMELMAELRRRQINDPEDLLMTGKSATFLEDNNRASEAYGWVIDMLEKADEQAPLEPGELRILAEAYEGVKDAQGVLYALERLESADQLDPQDRIVRVKAFEMEGDYYAALEDVSQALDEEVLPEWLYLRARLHAQLGNWEDALSDTDAALDLRPADPSTLSLRGLVKVERGDLEGAYTDIRYALGLDRGLAEGYLNLGRYFMALGKYQHAWLELESAYSLDPELRHIHFFRGATLFELGRNEEAFEELQISKELGDPEAETFIRTYFFMG
ncbi:tetratricopeptide repeat protein [Pontibacter sp. G13]|uniref:tetratricopeptide repeat protein n=1 Tax=Pontibacter sp. G13 TaxID=3074898 RepID=UPI00288A7605|nr:tetratricopeptide repeat protein [Pontibacter sp. G13]WNJ19157.1 tetratricopeptide repeat protein [Pontibacter sp. G13]